MSQIQEWSSRAEWRHVPTNKNPADIVSRGCTVTELCSSYWFEGPDFMQQSRECWPDNPHFRTSSVANLPDVRKSKSVCVVSQLQTHLIIEIISRYSSYIKILRTIAYVYRFITPRNNNKPKQLTAIETKVSKFSRFIWRTIVRNKYLRYSIPGVNGFKFNNNMST